MNENRERYGCQPWGYNIRVFRWKQTVRRWKREAICIDLFVPFQRTITCRKMESRSRSECISTLYNHVASLLTFCSKLECQKCESKIIFCCQKSRSSSVKMKLVYYEVHSLKMQGWRQ